MKTEAEIWKKINEPKVEQLIIFYDKNGKPTGIMPIVDRAPKKWIKWKTMRRKQK